MITSAFTCTGPYAILIMLGIKRVENRSACPSPMKGRCAISCSKSFCREEFGRFVAWASAALPPADFDRLPAWSDVAEWPGGVVGCADYSCRARTGNETWDEGYPYWWDLSNVVSFDHPVPCRGNTGMWRMPPSLAASVSALDMREQCVGATVATADEAMEIFRRAVGVTGSSEGFFVLPLDRDGRALASPILVALGDPTTTVVRPADVFVEALKVDAASIVVAHNHPSGDTTPSFPDRELTTALKRMGDELGIKVLDHLIVGKAD